MADPIDLRHRALTHAITAHAHTGADPATIVDAANHYHAYLSGADTPANGDREVAGPAPTRAPGRPRAAPRASPDAVASKPAAAAAATPAAAASSPKAAPAVAGKPMTIPGPVTIAEAAASLKALVQSKEPGRGRDVAVALLAEYGVEQLSQIPPAKLAEFKARMDNAGSEGAAATEPGDDLLG